MLIGGLLVCHRRMVVTALRAIKVFGWILSDHTVFPLDRTHVRFKTQLPFVPIHPPPRPVVNPETSWGSWRVALIRHRWPGLPHVINAFRRRRRRRKKRGRKEGLTFKVRSEERNQGLSFFRHQVLSCSLQSVHGDCAAQQEKTWPDQTSRYVAENVTHSLDPRARRVQLVWGKMRQDRYRTRLKEDMLMLLGCSSPPPIFNPILLLSLALSHSLLPHAVTWRPFWRGNK